MGTIEKASMMLKYSLASTLICCFIFLLYAVLYRKGKKIGFEDIIIAIVLIVVSSLRYNVGSDYMRYLSSASFAANRFADLRELYSKEILLRYNLEVGYETISVITSRFITSKYAILWVVSIILYIPIIRYCRKYTNNARAALATFLFWGFWGLTLNITKQAISMVFVLYAYKALEKHKFFDFVILSVLATSFHVTTLAVLVILLIIHFQIFKKFWEPSFGNLVIMIVVGLVLRFGTWLIVRIVSKIGLYSKYISFLNADASSGINRKYIMFGAFIETVFVVSILYIAIKNNYRLKKSDPNIDQFISIIMIGVPFSIIGISKTLWLSNRFAKYFFFFLLVLIPDLFGNDGNDRYEEMRGKIILRKNQLFFWVLMIAWHAIYAVLMLDNNGFKIQTYLFQ